MSSKPRTVEISGSTFLSLLLLLFIALKLCHVIDWSWWWVLAPFWMPLALFLGVLASVLTVVAIKKLAKGRRQRR